MPGPRRLVILIAVVAYAGATARGQVQQDEHGHAGAPASPSSSAGADRQPPPITAMPPPLTATPPSLTATPPSLTATPPPVTPQLLSPVPAPTLKSDGSVGTFEPRLRPKPGNNNSTVRGRDKGSPKARPRLGPGGVKEVEYVEDVDLEEEEQEAEEQVPSTRSPKLDVEWVLPPTKANKPLDSDDEAEVWVAMDSTTSSTSSATPTSTATTTTSTSTSTTEVPTTRPTSTSTVTTARSTTEYLTTSYATTTISTEASAATSTTDASTAIYIEPSTASSTTVATAPNGTRPIVPKCCPPGQRVLGEKKKCVDSPFEFIPPFVEYEEERPEAALDGSLLYDTDADDVYQEDTVVTEGEGYDMIVGNPCRYGRFRLEPHVADQDEFYLLANGSLVAPYLFGQPLSPDEFCMDVFPDTDNGDVVVLPLVCFPPPEQGSRRSGLQFILYPIGLLLSVPFLVTTFALYAMTPSLRDVHGKALMCQVVCLAVAYVTLAFVQLWGAHLNRSLCFSIACVVQFSFVACFLWLNVMCINTWYNMAYRPALKWSRRAERRRFVLYSMYAWSLPCILLGVTLVMDLTPTIPPSYVKPRFGVDFCWFQTDRAALPYFYAPVTVLVVINVVLFVLTACAQCRRRRTFDASVMSLTGDTCYTRHSNIAFRSCFCLFVAMGLNWVMEVVSYYVAGPPYIWYATDVLNCLQGVWTFIVFVLNRPARQEIRARWMALRRGDDDSIRIPEEPQIDDFQTVVQRQSRLIAHLTPWQQEIRGVHGMGGPELAVKAEREPLNGTVGAD